MNRKRMWASLLVIGFIFFSGANALAAPFDFDGDGLTDIAIYRPANNQLWHLRSSDNQSNTVQLGTGNDYLTSDDYTGDGKTDFAFFRFSTGEWFIIRSEDNSYYSFTFGTLGDYPTSGDFDGDGKADPAIFREQTGTWYILRSSGGVDIQQFGLERDFPVVADYDGDGRDDIAIYRQATGEWWIQRSRDGVAVYRFTSSISIPRLGSPVEGGDMIPVPADYTGDGRADLAFFENPTGKWFVLKSEDPSSFYSFPFGLIGDFPAPGDYDGDGKADAAVFRKDTGTWFLQQSTNGFKAVTFGAVNDIPVAFYRYTND